MAEVRGGADVHLAEVPVEGLREQREDVEAHGQASGLVEQAVDDDEPVVPEAHELVDQRDEDVGAVGRPHRPGSRGRASRSRRAPRRPTGPRRSAPAAPAGRRRDSGAARRVRRRPREAHGPASATASLAGRGEVEKHERAPVRPAHARDRAGPGLTGALFGDVEALAQLEPVEPAGREVQVELPAEAVDLAEDSAGPES